jgi:proteasome assembly chaperone (PAC2) family protein
MGFSGWMDSGDVSTGTLQGLIDKLRAQHLARIDPKGLYIYNFPGTLEWASMFRPHTKIKDGTVENYSFPSNDFYYDAKTNLILFIGKEPNMQWEEYANSIFLLCEQFQVGMIYFVGSVSSLVPHTREPRLMCVTSNVQLKDRFKHYGVKFTNYEGPASMATYLCSRCGELKINMVSLIAAVPAYVQGNNPKCIEAMTRRLIGMLDLPLNLDDLKRVTEEFEQKLNELVSQQPDLAGNISRLEEDYDNDIFDNELGELKTWLEQQGIRLD